MYESDNISLRIKLLAKKQNQTIKMMLTTCELGRNTMSHLDSGKSISSSSLAKIADYLNCSVDYLLGRTDNPAINNEPVIDPEEIIERFDGLSGKSKNEFVKYLNKLTLEQKTDKNNIINKEAK